MGHQQTLFYYSLDRAFAAANMYPAAFCCSFTEVINSLGALGLGVLGVLGALGAFGTGSATRNASG